MPLNHSRILVTGATGFVGRALLARLQNSGRPVRVALRTPASICAAGEKTVVGDIGPDTDWQLALQGVGCVVHLAARTHVLDEDSADPMSAYRDINVLGSIRLAQQAAAAGVSRLIFMSSVKVNGEATRLHPFTETDVPAPLDAYGVTKAKAENALQRIGTETGIEIIILRPPLVYGPGVKGNLLRLLDLVHRGIPLPLASVRNQRSLLYVDNLADAIVCCVDAPAAGGAIYMVSDGEDISTPGLINKLAVAMGKMPRLLPCPPTLLTFGAGILGKRAMALRLTGSLAVDSSRIRRNLGWEPRCSLDQGLNAMVQWYHRGKF
ncbi:MAG: SDR family oxidoreductase [Xanthomonadales bacterium]|nr:SDR family oxidoreductase [Xanthomonadales bacterium]